MKNVNIKLSTIEDVKSFVNAVTLYNGDADLSGGRYVVDAKSIMGIFSLDLLSPIEMIIHCDECDALLEEIKEFIVE